MAEMLDAAETQVALSGGPDARAALVVAAPEWPIGLVGLIAARLAERYQRPAIAFERGAELSRGSARAPEGVDLMAALRATAPLLERFGGHRRAAGLALPSARLDEFRDALSVAVLDACDGELPAPELALDAELAHDELALDTVALLNALEPFGAGNAPPLLLVRDLALRSCRPSSNGKHLLLQVTDHVGRAHDAVFFSAGARLDELRALRRLDLATELRRDVWNGRVRLKLRVVDFRPTG
jgi:single-stranded-DNA-specific exonuclease